jgi:hypothetical protein
MSVMRTFDTGATRHTDEGKLDFEGFLSPLVLERYAQYMHRCRVQADGNLRDSDNWQKGIPKKDYMKSAWRHFFDWWKMWRRKQLGHLMEDAICGLLFNASGFLHEMLKEQLDAELSESTPVQDNPSPCVPPLRGEDNPEAEREVGTGYNVEFVNNRVYRLPIGTERVHAKGAQANGLPTVPSNYKGVPSSPSYTTIEAPEDPRKQDGRHLDLLEGKVQPGRYIPR